MCRNLCRNVENVKNVFKSNPKHRNIKPLSLDSLHYPRALKTTPKQDEKISVKTTGVFNFTGLNLPYIRYHHLSDRLSVQTSRGRKSNKNFVGNFIAL